MIFDSAATEDADGNVLAADPLYYTKFWIDGSDTERSFDGDGGGPLNQNYRTDPDTDDYLQWYYSAGVYRTTKPIKIHGSDGNVGLEFHFDFGYMLRNVLLHLWWWIEFCNDVPFFMTDRVLIPGTTRYGIKSAFQRWRTAPGLGDSRALWSTEQGEVVRGSSVIEHRKVMHRFMSLGAERLTWPSTSGHTTTLYYDDRYVEFKAHANYARIGMTFGNSNYYEAVPGDSAQSPADAESAYKALERLRVFAVVGGVGSDLSVEKPVSGFYP